MFRFEANLPHVGCTPLQPAPLSEHDLSVNPSMVYPISHVYKALVRFGVIVTFPLSGLGNRLHTEGQNRNKHRR